MSATSEKQRMREALQLVERNLGSLIAARYSFGLPDNGQCHDILTGMRRISRQAMGYATEERECICPRCGIRHGLAPVSGDF